MQIIKNTKTDSIRTLEGSFNDFSIRYAQLKSILITNKLDIIFAEPSIANNVIVWKTELKGKIVNYTNLSKEEKEKTDKLLGRQAAIIKQRLINIPYISKKIDIYLNIPSDESKYLIRTDKGDKVILIQWGCITDDAAKSSTKISVEGEYPVPVIFKTIFKDNTIAANEKIYINYNKNEYEKFTNNQGIINFGNAYTGKTLSTYQIVENKKCNEQKFICDGRDEYIIKIPKNQNMLFKVQYKNGKIVSSKDFIFEYSGKTKKITTNNKGEIQLKDIRPHTKVNIFILKDGKKEIFSTIVCEENRKIYKLSLPNPIQIKKQSPKVVSIMQPDDIIDKPDEIIEKTDDKTDDIIEKIDEYNPVKDDESEKKVRRKKIRKRILIAGGATISLSAIIYGIMIFLGVFAIVTYTGMKFNDSVYDSLKTQKMLSKASYVTLAKNFSLKPYCPTPKQQGQYGTCVGWSSSYAARTIVEAYKKGWKNQTNKINENAFSPLFVYGLIYVAKDNCSDGTSINQAMKVLTKIGDVKLKEFPKMCACESEVPLNLKKKASVNKIERYSKLFDRRDKKDVKIKTVKKAISVGNPVVIGMMCYSSFSSAKGVWNGVQDRKRGGHAMCVVGWDDNKYGGAFEIMNSWGTDWGNNGFIWVKYSDFAKNVKYAFELNGSNIPKVKENYELSALLQFKLISGKFMKANCLISARASKLVKVSKSHYRILNSYKSGTKYRIYITNKQAAYVYVIGSDITGTINKLFPPDNKTSPYISYANSTISLPDDKYYIELDNTIGTDYIAVFYSKSELDFNTLLTKLKTKSGSFSQKINSVFGAYLVEDININYKQDKIFFEATSKNKITVPIIIEMKHTR